MVACVTGVNGEGEEERERGRKMGVSASSEMLGTECRSQEKIRGKFYSSRQESAFGDPLIRY